MRALLLAPGQLGGLELCEFEPLSVSSGAADGRRRSPSAATTKNTWQKKQTKRQNNPDSRGGETDDTKTTEGLFVCSVARLVVLFDILKSKIPKNIDGSNDKSGKKGLLYKYK